MAIDRNEAKYLLLAEFILKADTENIKKILDAGCFRIICKGLNLKTLRRKDTNPDMYAKAIALFENDNQECDWDGMISSLKMDLKTNDDALDFVELFLTPQQVTKAANILPCMKMLMAGKTYKEITEQLGFSSSVVSFASNILYYDFNDSKELLESLTTNYIDDDKEFQISKKTIKKYLGKNEKVVIPNDITIIDDNAFENCDFITEVAFPESLLKIGSCAFRRCKNLTKIIIPKSVGDIGNRAFDGCENIVEIEIKSYTTQVGLFAFSGCSNSVVGKLFFEYNLPLYCFDESGTKHLLSMVWDEDLAKNNPEKLKEMRIQLLEAQFDKLSMGAFYEISNDKIYKIEIPDYYITDLDRHSQHQLTYADMVTAKEMIEKHCVYNNDFDSMEIDYENFENSKLYEACTCHDVETLARLISIVVIFVIGETYFEGKIYEDKWNERGDYSVRFPVELRAAYNLPSYKAYENPSYNERNDSGIITNEVILERKAKIVSTAENKKKDLKEDWQFKINEKKKQATITAYIGNDVDVVVPNEIDGNIVIEIANSAFSSSRKECVSSVGKHLSEKLNSVTISENVKTIGIKAFYGCAGLTDVIIPKSVKSIKKNAFANCSNLVNMNSLDAVETIDDEAFYGCSSLTEITTSNNLKEVGESVFEYCTGLKSIIVKGAFLGKKMFKNCTSLENVNLSDSISIIPSYAFESCDSLKTIDLPKGLTSIRVFAFSNCNSLTNISIPNGTTVIDCLAFANNYSLSSIEIPDSVTLIDSQAFIRCSSLKSIKLPNKLAKIGNHAFYGCTGLTSIEVPDNVKEIEHEAFRECVNLSSITLPENIERIGSNAFANTVYYNDESNWENGVLYMGSNLVGVKDDIGETYQVKDGTTTISRYMLSDCYGLKKVILPDSVKDINAVFAGCKQLVSVELPSGIEKIGEYAFKDCLCLQSVEIPNSVTEICSDAFNGCAGLKSIILPEGLIKIGYSTFAKCNNLTEITIPDGCCEFCSYAFNDCTNLTKISIPTTVVNFPWNNAFTGCNNLTIYAPAGSKAEEYANKYNINFIAE